MKMSVGVAAFSCYTHMLFVAPAKVETLSVNLQTLAYHCGV